MPQPTKGPRLGGSPAHQRLILANLATQLFEHRRITTTEAKARRLRPYAEKLITKAKRGDLHNIREIAKVIRDKDVIHALVTDIGPFFADRQGGYTRITKIMPRKGDNAPMAVIELVREPLSAKKATVKEAEGATKRAAKQAEAKDAAAEIKKVEDAGGTVDAEHPVDVSADAPADTSDASADGEYGADSAAPNEDGSAPAGFDIKGNKDSMKYHEPDGQWYTSTVAEVWFRTAEAAEKAGFVKAGAAN